MYYKIKVLVCESENSKQGIKKLCSLGFDAREISKDGREVYKKIRLEHPDVVIIKAYMPGMDAITVMNKIKNSACKRPMYIVTADYDSRLVNRELMKNGAAYILMEPFDYLEAGERIAGLLNLEEVEEDELKGDEREEEIAEVLHHLGVPAHINGYKYAREAVILAMADASILESVTKRMYPEIADRHSTTPARVERAIRHAIEIAWSRGELDTLNEYFGCTIAKGRGKPTNSEFIAMIADKLLLQKREHERQAKLEVVASPAPLKSKNFI